MYSFKSRVRYSETGPGKKITLPSIINYFQDCSTFHSEAVGLGIDYLETQKQVWLLSSWQVVINRYPVQNEPIEICTWPYAFKGFYGYRNFLMKDEAGNSLAYANSIWIFVSTKTGHPIRMTEKEKNGYPPEPRLEMDYAPRKILLPQDFVRVGALTVRKDQIDTNQHVNNCQYIQMAQEYLPADFTVGQVRAEYKKSAVYQDPIILRLNKTSDIATVLLEDQEGLPYAVIEFTAQKTI